jgi:hypothetical protein
MIDNIFMARDNGTLQDRKPLQMRAITYNDKAAL